MNGWGRLPGRYWDFVVIAAPECWMLRPVSHKGQAFIQANYPEHKRGIFDTLLFNKADSFHDAIERLSGEGMRIEIL